MSNFEGDTKKCTDGSKSVITNFEKTGSINVLGKKKPVSVAGIQKSTLQVEENKAYNVHASSSTHAVAEGVNMPRSAVQNMMGSALQYYRYKL